MKKTLLSLSLLSIAFGTHAAEYKMTGSSSGGVDDKQWNDPAAWEQGAVPSSTDDVLFHESLIVRWTSGDTIVVNNLKRTGWSGNTAIATLTSEEESNIPSISDYLLRAPSLLVNGNLEMNQGQLILGSATQSRGFKNITVKGDVLLNNPDNAPPKLATVFVPDNGGVNTYSRTNLSMDVGGVVRFNADDSRTFHEWAINRSGSGDTDYGKVNAFVRVGGMDGWGVIANQDTGAVSSTIIFENPDGNFKGGEFDGTLKHYYNGSSSFNIVMNDSAGVNRQVMRIRSFAENTVDHKAAINVSVEKGVFGLYTDSGDATSRLASLNISGGVLEIVEPQKTTTELGSGLICTDNTNITGGEILFDLISEGGSYYNDSIETTNITGANGTFVINLGGDFAWGDEIDISDIALFRYITGTNSYDAASTLVKIMFDGQDITAYLDKVDLRSLGGSLVLDIAGTIVVPEPAEVAALLGLAALVFAAYRRRK